LVLLLHFAEFSSDMVTASIRKGGLGFLQHHRRLNVALTRAIDALFIIADVKAMLEQVPVAQALAEGEVLDPESQGLDLAELQQGQGILKKIAEFYVNEKCTYPVDIGSLSSKYISFKEAEVFAAYQISNQKACFKCQQPGHISANCTNPEVSRAPKPRRCKTCNAEGHVATDCPEQLCHGCGEMGHPRLSCRNKPIICHNCKMVGHLSYACPFPKKNRGPRLCFTCGLETHRGDQCPNT
jgi:hypothetical protein